MMKKFFLTLLALIILVIVAITIFLLTFDLNRYRSFAQTKLSEILKYQVQIGAMETKLSLIPTIQIKDFKILTKDGTQSIVNIPKVLATLEIKPLLQKEIAVQRIDIDSLDLDLTTLEPDTKKYQEKTIDTTSTKKKKTFEEFWIDRINVKHFVCKFMNQDKKDMIEVDDISLNNLDKFSFKLNYQKNDIFISGSFGPLLKLITERKTLPVDLKLKQGSSIISIKGQIGELSSWDKIRLNININIDKLSSILKAWQVRNSLPDVFLTTKLSLEGNRNKVTISNLNIDFDKGNFILKGSGTLTEFVKKPTLHLEVDGNMKNSNLASNFGVKPFEMKTNLLIDKTHLNLSNFSLLANRTDLNGTIDVDWENKPVTIQPQLKSSYLNLSDILDKKLQHSTSAETPTTSKHLDTQILVWDILRKINIKGTLDIDNIMLSDKIADYAKIKMQPNLDKGVLTLAVQMNFLSGKITSQIVLNSENKTATIQLNGSALELDKIKPVSQNLKGSFLNASVALKSTGNTLKEMTSNTNGKLVLELIGGTIVNKWFNSLPTTINAIKQKTGHLAYSTADQKTEVTCGAINVPVVNGVIRSTENIALQTDVLNLVLNGSVDLNTESIDLKVIPSLNQETQTNNLLSMVQVISLTGPWHDISTKVDAESIVEGALASLLKPTAITETSLCQQALGKQVSVISQTKEKVPQQKVTETKTQPQKENLKQQLFDSLTQVLATAGAK